MAGGVRGLIAAHLKNHVVDSTKKLLSKCASAGQKRAKRTGKARIDLFMINPDHLSLRTVRLKESEEWINREEDLSFVLPIEGAGIHVCGDSNQVIGPGDVLVVSRASLGKLRVLAKDEMRFWFFSATAEHLFPLLASGELCLMPRVTEKFKSARLYAAHSAVAAACHELVRAIPQRVDLVHRSHLLKAAATVFSTEFSNARSQEPELDSAERRLMEVLEQLPINEVLELSVTELAARFNCGRRHLNRLFQQYFGLSITALRMEMRLLKAVSLLRDPAAKVINVAGQSGFSHLGLFNACFKRRFGLTPGQWRNGSQETEVHLIGPVGAQPNCRLLENGLCQWSQKTPTDSSSAAAANPSASLAVFSTRLLSGPAEGNGSGNLASFAGNQGRLVSRGHTPEPTLDPSQDGI